MEVDSKDFREIQAQWATVRGRIRQKIADAQFKSWIKVISLKNCVDGKVILSVPSKFVRTRIIEQYLEIIKSYWLVQNLKIDDIEIVEPESSISGLLGKLFDNLDSVKQKFLYRCTSFSKNQSLFFTVFLFMDFEISNRNCLFFWWYSKN